MAAIGKKIRFLSKNLPEFVLKKLLKQFSFIKEKSLFFTKKI